MGHHKWGFNRHPAPTTRGAIVPHVGSHMNLQVSFRGKSFAAHGAFEGLITSVGSNMDLQGTGAGEPFLANLALVLQWSSSQERRGILGTVRVTTTTTTATTGVVGSGGASNSWSAGLAFLAATLADLWRRLCACLILRFFLIVYRIVGIFIIFRVFAAVAVIAKGVRQIAYFMCQHVLLHVPFRGK